jgi:hypothetical protein
VATAKFEISDADIQQKVEKVAIDMLWSHQNQNMQVFGVHIAIILCKDECGLLFNNLLRTL